MNCFFFMSFKLFMVKKQNMNIIDNLISIYAVWGVSVLYSKTGPGMQNVTA